MKEFTETYKVVIDNLFGIDASFKTDARKEGVCVPGYIKNHKVCTVLDAQDAISKGCPYFCGIDGEGAHAQFLIKNPEMREFLLKTTKEPVQLTMKNIEKMLSATSETAFKKSMEELIQTKSEAKEILIRFEKIGLDKYAGWKGIMLERYCIELFNTEKKEKSENVIYS